jgi:serine O-acetyltransferase
VEFLTHKFEVVSVPLERFSFKRGLLHRLEADVRARAVWYKGDASCRAQVRAILYEGFVSTVTLRVGEALGALRAMRPLGKLVFELLRLFTHISVGCGARFGPGLVLLHPFGLHIHKTVNAGANLVLQNSITLGGEGDRGPALEDNVFIGVGARVIGPITLGNRCRVGANAVVMASVREDHVAAGNPARQIPIQRPEEKTS